MQKTSTAALAFCFLVFAYSSPAFPAPPASANVQQTYDQLVHAIREARAASRGRLEQAVEREKVREAWEIGKLIDEHILQHKERADYGKRVLEQLARDLDASQTEFSYMLQFARAYSIYPQGDKLSWSHYRSLLAINDAAAREALARKAKKEGWDRDRLRAEVRKRRLSENSKESAFVPPRLEAQKGILDTYRIVVLEGRPVINLGFSNYLELSPKDAKRFKEGDIVRVSKGKPELVKGATESLVPFQLFSYRARVLEITDGDTFWTLVDLGFGITTKQQLRLRGLDAPEIESAAGKEAKRFIENELKNAPQIIITSTKSDKYDRYLADVWVGETYINQELIDKDLAVRVSE